ncbi:MAG: LemA family protein [Bacilli bacterium]|jgi:LemA protein|nr:LemA family protein [Bacilli bacterium]
MPIGLWVVLGILVIIILFVITSYNGLVVLRNRVRDQWAQIDVQLKRRFDLIPNLVETVKGYAKHESETLENVIKARNTFLSATTPDAEMEADGELTKAITKLFALTESYPELKANTNFMELQTELRQTEEKIASSRQFYNDTVLTYNNKIEVIPTNIIASLFNFKREAFFQAQEKERENVQVKF